MKFLGLLCHTKLSDKGEYSNYRGEQTDNSIYGHALPGYDTIISLTRLKFIRLCFSILVNQEGTDDPVYRLRPLLNIFPRNCQEYLDLGRNLSADESSIASRSKFGRDLIVFNPTKPGDKYHCRLYILTAADKSWFIYNFRIHCKDLLAHRLGSSEDINTFAQETDGVSTLRKLVLEICQPRFGTGRIVNMDNYYTSPQLLEQMYIKGLYCRGTVRTNKSHVPQYLVYSKQEGNQLPRGTTRHGVCTAGVNRPIIFASWVDGSVVNIISNVDSTDPSIVTRQSKS